MVILRMRARQAMAHVLLWLDGTINAPDRAWLDQMVVWL
jgi:hypothetical protein